MSEGSWEGKHTQPENCNRTHGAGSTSVLSVCGVACMETLTAALQAGGILQAWSSVTSSGGDSIIIIICLGRKIRHTAAEAAAAWKAAQWVVLGSLWRV